MAVWSTGGNGWGNGTNVATDKNPGTTQTNVAPTGSANNITGVFAYGSPIAPNTKIQFEIVVGTGGGVQSPWFFLQSANGVGCMSSASMDLGSTQSYNQVVELNGVGNAFSLSDPEGDKNNNNGAGWPGSPIQAAPSWWINGTRITILVDRIANQITYITHGATGATIGGQSYGTSGTSGPWSISSWGSTIVYPFAVGWWLGGGTFTLLGGGTGQTLSYPQAGYTNLDGGAVVVSNPITSITITETPNPVVTATPFSVTATANQNWTAASDVYLTDTASTSANSFAPASSLGTVQITGAVATITGLTVGALVPHNIAVQSQSTGVISNAITLQVNAVANPTTILMNSPAIRLSPFTWSRTSTTTFTTYAVGSFVDCYLKAGASPTLVANLAFSAATNVDWLINGAIVGQGVAAATALNITGLVANSTNWVRLYMGATNGTFISLTVNSFTCDSGSSAGTAPAALKSILFAGDSISMAYEDQQYQGYVFLIAQSLGFTSWDIANQSYTGSGWIISGDGDEVYYMAPGQSGLQNRWDHLYPTGASLLDANGIFSALGALNTPPTAICWNLGTNEALQAASIGTMTGDIVAVLALIRAATSPSTALIMLMPLGLEDPGSTVMSNGPTYAAGLTAAVQQANAAGSNVQMVDLGAAFSTSMRTGGYYIDGIHPTPAGHVKVAAAYLAGIQPFLSGSVSNPATVNITVPSPVVAGTQPINGTFTNGTNPPNFWLAWAPSPYILTTASYVKLATITGSSFTASMTLTAPIPAGQSGNTSTIPLVSTMYYSTTANQAVSTITNSSLGIITLPTFPDQLQAAPVTFQISFNYQPVQSTISISNTVSATPIFSPLATSTTLPVGAAITVPASIPTQKSGQAFSIEVGFNYVPNRANLYFSPFNGNSATTVINGSTYSSFSLLPPNPPSGAIVWSANGQLATLTFELGSAGPWSFQVVDQSGAGVKSAALSFANTATTGGGGTYTVAAPGAPLTVSGSANVLWDSTGQLATVTIANAVLGAFNLQIEDTTYPTPVQSAVIAYNVTAVASAAAATLTVPTPPSPIVLTSQTNGAWILAPGNWTIPVAATTETLTINWSNGTKFTKVVSAGLTIVSQTLQEYTIVAFTPAQLKPNTPLTVTGEFIAGTPAILDLSTNGGATWTPILPPNVTIAAIAPSTAVATGIAQAPATTIPITLFTGAFSVTLPAGLPAGTYASGQIMVRDHNIPSVFGSAGFLVVSAFDVTALSGPLVFGFDPAIPACIGLDSTGAVQRINDIRGNGMHASIGPTATPTPATFTSTTPLTVNPGTDVLDAAPVGPKATFVHLSGLDSTRTMVGLTPTNIADNLWDPEANFLSFGKAGIGGPNDALITMFGTTNMEVGTQTIVEAVYIDTTVNGGGAGGYGIGLIWGLWDTTQTVSYLTPGRWHSSNFAAQFYDSVSGMSLSNGVTMSTSTWGVVTMQRNGTLFQWRINKGPWTTATITSTSGFNPTNCYWGGSVSNSLNQPGGNAFRLMGAHYSFSGFLTATELASVESLAGMSIGQNI